MRPLAGLAAVVGAALAAAAAGWFTGDPVLWQLAWGLVGTAVVAAVVLPAPLGRVDVDRVWDSRPKWAGETLTVTFTLKFPRGWLWWYVAVSDSAPAALGGIPTRLRASVVPWRRRSVELSYRLPNLTRGLHRWSDVVLETGDPWGFVRRRRTVRLPMTVEVWPRPAAVHLDNVAGLAGESGIRSLRPHHAAPAPEVSGIRAMQPGDPWTRVHWRTTVRAGRLMVKQQPTLAPNDLMVEVAEPDRFTAAEYETALSLAAGLIQEAVTHGYRVGLTMRPGPAVAPVSGLVGARRLMALLARAVHSKTADSEGPKGRAWVPVRVPLTLVITRQEGSETGGAGVVVESTPRDPRTALRAVLP